MATLDLDAIRDEYLKQCGPHDFGLVEYGCNCPSGEPRWAIQQLADEVERLRQELDEARAERDAATTLRSAFTELEFALREEKHARKINEYGLLAKLRDAEAERDRMRPVVEAAEAWRDAGLFGLGTDKTFADAVESTDLTDEALRAAVDAYRSATPDAEPAPGVPVDTTTEGN